MADTKGTVLVVDDEEAIRQVASDMLTFLGYTVITASSGEKAIECMKTGARPDVVLLDLVMPGISGFQTLHKLREIDPGLPILISSGYSGRVLATEGVDGFVNKPYQIETLARQLEKVQRAGNRPE